jgi:hypothetical protein
MGIEEVEALDLARKIAIFNSEVIYNIKNSLMLMTTALEKKMVDDKEKFRIMIKTKYPNADAEILLATTTNNQNHDLLKIDVELIKEMLLDGRNESGN